jgi:hypothetical protein
LLVFVEGFVQEFWGEELQTAQAIKALGEFTVHSRRVHGVH